MMVRALKRDWWLLGLNAVAMVAYAWANAWGIFELPNPSFDVEHALVTYLRVRVVFPLLAVVALIDAAWLVLRVRRISQAETSAFAFSAIALFCGWIAFFVIHRLPG